MVWDTLIFDRGTTDSHNDSIWNNTNYITRGEEYSTIFNENSGVSKFIAITGDINIELDIRTSMEMTEQLFRINNTGTTLKDITGNDCRMTTNEWKRIRIIILDNKLTVEDGTITNYDVTGFNRLYIRLLANQQNQFKNLMIYPV